MAKPSAHRDEVILVRVGAQVKKYRLQKGYSQETLANYCEVELSTIYRIEKGKISPTLSLLFTIAGNLDTTASELINIEMT